MSKNPNDWKLDTSLLKPGGVTQGSVTPEQWDMERPELIIIDDPEQEQEDYRERISKMYNSTFYAREYMGTFSPSPYQELIDKFGLVRSKGKLFSITLGEGDYWYNGDFLTKSHDLEYMYNFLSSFGQNPRAKTLDLHMGGGLLPIHAARFEVEGSRWFANQRWDSHNGFTDEDWVEPDYEIIEPKQLPEAKHGRS